MTEYSRLGLLEVVSICEAAWWRHVIENAVNLDWSAILLPCAYRQSQRLP
jgi:hypothetical protein